MARTPPPPLLPIETLRRVLRTARLDGAVVMAVAGAAAIASALSASPVGMMTGLAIAGAGAAELHGASLLAGGARRGLLWMIAAQGALLSMIVAYCVWRWGAVTPAYVEHILTAVANEPGLLPGQTMGQFIDDAIQTKGITRAEFVAQGVALLRTAYGCAALLTVAFQGAMMRYYLRRAEAINAALHSDYEIVQGD